jgi:hypothetical protein
MERKGREKRPPEPGADVVGVAGDDAAVCLTD